MSNILFGKSQLSILINITCIVRFQALTAASMKFRVFLDELPCSQVDDRRFRGAYCLHHQGDDGPDDGGSMHL
jgi:hypothetical protein